MKLRLLEDSIRLRLLEPEVADIAAGIAVVGETSMPGGALLYRLSVSGEDVQAEFVDSIIEVTISERIAQEWASSQQVSIRGISPIDGGETKILIEKDFTCINPAEDEDQTGTFANPNLQH